MSKWHTYQKGAIGTGNIFVVVFLVVALTGGIAFSGGLHIDTKTSRGAVKNSTPLQLTPTQVPQAATPTFGTVQLGQPVASQGAQ